ncbi:hypothetical protein FBALC1_03342 [Flavobacteriales bacterium ALC-1]|nr:hypothetical protein FBALC1_03342 [Flavobacteriales bacterium ALC-1]
MNFSNHELKKIIKNDVSKNFNLFTRGILSLMVLGLTISSCSDNDESSDSENQLEDTLEVQRSAEIDQIDNVLGDLVIEVYEDEESGIADRNSQSRDIPECVTITVVAQQGYRQVTIDFGSEGCMIRGHLIKGQIVFDYTRDTEAQQIMINYNLIDFYFDAKNIIASRSIFKELSNENGNPQFTHDLSITVIWPNGAQASREGTKVREWIEGFGSGIFSDNVFEVTGDWTATFVNGNTHTYEVLTPLRREVICTYFVSGTFDVQRTNFGGVFDYGEGDCDNQASFTFNNGQEITITLN